MKYMFFCLLSEEEVKAWKEWKKIALKVPQSVEPSHYFRGKVNAGTVSTVESLLCFVVVENQDPVIICLK